MEGGTRTSYNTVMPSQPALPPTQPTIAYLTAGGAGMFCGSCMHDNTLAAAMIKQGCDVVLVPLYTPIRTDEEDVTINKVFFGGINVYLQQKVGLFRYLPRLADRWLDWPWLLNLVGGGRIQVSARELGDITVSMLQGEHGVLRKEVDRLVSWLAADVRPSLLNLSNMLIAGCVPELKRRLNAPVLITLQGDDLFLDGLVEPHKSQAMREIRRLLADVDGFVVSSQYYAEHMSQYLDAPREKFDVVPLGLDLRDFQGHAAGLEERPPTVGFFARVCPEKGLHVLVEAFIKLARMPGMEEARLRVAGWLGAGDRKYFNEQVQRLRAAGLAERFRYAGVLERQEKLDFLRGLDLLSVPTVYREPKGIFALEALASGVPIVQPAHGSFPELLAATGGGRLVRPSDPEHLAATLHELLTNHDERRRLGQVGRDAVHRDYTADRMAKQTLEVYRKYLPSLADTFMCRSG